jgi:hypothetical protein
MLKHLSYTKMSMFMKSRKQFIKKYILKEKMFVTKEMKFWKAISDKLERWEDIPWVKVLDTPEQELRLDINWVPCLWFIDTCCKDFNHFAEYKTWKVAWTQAKVDKHDQLLMYAACIHEMHGKIPTCELIWIETKNCDVYAIQMTWNVKTFERSFTLEEIETFKESLPVIWEAMNKLIK